jgi:hypothetical protein
MILPHTNQLRLPSSRRYRPSTSFVTSHRRSCPGLVPRKATNAMRQPRGKSMRSNERMPRYPRMKLGKGLSNRRRPVVQASFEKKTGYRRTRRGDAGIARRRLQGNAADNWRYPVGRCLCQTLSSVLWCHLLVQASDGVRRRICSGTISGGNPNSEGKYSHYHDQREATTAPSIFGFCQR